jgi:transposase
MEAKPPGQGCPNCERLQREVAELKARIAKLEALLEAAARRSKRQAAPFSKGTPKKKPKRPGRKPGDEYGEHHRRVAPETVDETHDVPLPECCPHCGGKSFQDEHVCEQFQFEIPRKPLVRRFDIHVAECSGCGRRVQGRHELQTSDALGAAAVQLGPDAHAAAAVLNKEFGLSHGKVAKVFARLFGLAINRSTSARSMLRTAKRLEPAAEDIRRAIRGSPQITCDETGWRIGGEKAWLHVAVAQDATWYEVARHRDHTVLECLIGLDYSGTLIHDGWSVYDRFEAATHQQCVAHILRRARDLASSATRAAARFPQQVLELFGRAFALRDRFRRKTIGKLTLACRGADLIDELQSLTQHTKRNAANERLAAHLERHLEEWFLFLIDTAIEPTSNAAERALRPAVVNRKVWGGNRTEAGASAQSILTSVIATCHQNALDVLNYLNNTLRAKQPLPLLG